MRIMFCVGVGLVSGVMCGVIGLHPITTFITLVGIVMITTSISFKIWPSK